MSQFTIVVFLINLFVVRVEECAGGLRASAGLRAAEPGRAAAGQEVLDRGLGEEHHEEQYLAHFVQVWMGPVLSPERSQRRRHLLLQRDPRGQLPH